jgi:aspartate/methionine/tyrosine aminotransferase
MSDSAQKKRSDYMEWAKTCSQARFNLATSGLTNVDRTEFHADRKELDITGPGSYGYTALQQRIARHTGVPEECVVATTGTSMANHLAMAAVLNPGDKVLIEHPTYGLLLDVANYLGARVARITRKLETGFAVDPGEIERAVTDPTRLVVLTNLHNPSGALLPTSIVREIGQIAQQAGAFVLMDEVYLEMLFDDQSSSSFAIGQELAGEACNPFIVTNSLTKAYGLSGLRCGWVLAAPDLAHRMWRLNDLFGVNAAHPAEQLSVTAFDQLDRFRDRTKALLSANRSLLESFLDSRQDLHCFRPPGGTVAFPRLAHGDPDAFIKLLREKYETSVVPGNFFGMPQHFRIGIGIDTAQLRRGLEHLSAALDEFARQ